MKKIILATLLVSLLFQHNVTGQLPFWQWAKNPTGNSGDTGSSIASDENGNIYVTGHFYSSEITFGNTTLVNNGVSDIFIVKYDPSGKLLWARSEGGSDDDRSYHISVDNYGNVYITGGFSSDLITFGELTLNNVHSFDIFITKYDSHGNVLWAKSAGSWEGELGFGLSIDNNYNVYLTGYFNSSTINFGNNSLSNAGKTDIFLAKYDSLGNELWAKSLGGLDHDRGTCVAIDSDDNVYFTGDFESPTLSIDNTILTKNGLSDIFIAKYNSSGNFLWAKSYGESGYSRSNGIQVDKTGNVYTAGHFARGKADILLTKYSPSGNMLWIESVGGEDVEWCKGLNVDLTGNIYIAGHFASFEFTFGDITLTNTSAGSEDILVAKYDSSGNELWAKSAKGNSNDYVNGICTDTNGNIYVTGEFRSSLLTFDDNITINNDGVYDIFIAKLGSSLTGISTQIPEIQLNIFPNPAQQSLSLSYNLDFPGEVYFTASSLNGKEIVLIDPEQKNAGKQVHKIDLNRLNRGFYLVRMYFKNQLAANRKLILVE